MSNCLDGVIGKTIASFKLETSDFDGGHDTPETLILTFSDGSAIKIHAAPVQHSRSAEEWADLEIEDC